MLSASQGAGGHRVDGKNVQAESPAQLKERNAANSYWSASDDMELAITDRVAGLNGVAGWPWAVAVQFAANMAAGVGTLSQQPIAR